jgi:hypothetical protein
MALLELDLAYKKGKKEAQAEFIKMIDEMFPICTCIEGRSGQEPNISCKNELMDGAWTDGINRELKERIKQLEK